MVATHRTRLTDLSAGAGTCAPSAGVRARHAMQRGAAVAPAGPAPSRPARVVRWTGAMEQRSPVHEIVNERWRALHELGSPATTGEIERWGFSIHAALSAAGREFHNHDHVIDLVTGSEPLEVIAAMYHDAVYIQVDQGLPRSMREELTSVLAQGADGWRVLPSAAAPVTGDVLHVFGRRVGDVVTPTTGLNELSSALVAAIQLEHALSREQRLVLAACIEQTIPFRIDPV